MKLKGRVEKAINGKRFLIALENEKIPELGDAVLSPDMMLIGKVVDVLGKVTSPHVLAVTIRPDIDPGKLIGRDVLIVKKSVGRPPRRRK
ncbi:MAG: hypothetical protein QW039_01380 [Fervidicoccaceae archaeon]